MSEYMHNRMMARDWNRRNFRPEALRLLEQAAEYISDTVGDDDPVPLLAKVIRQFIDDTKSAKEV